jgi:nitroreductase
MPGDNTPSNDIPSDDIPSKESPLEPQGPPAAANPVEEAILSRKSIRRFLPDPVPRETLAHLLAVASRAPSGVNAQPWRVYAVGGETQRKLSEALVKAYLHEPDEHQLEVEFSPERLPEPYKSRQREVGWALYGALGIEKGDRGRTRSQHARNFEFFDAPAGLIFTMERVLKTGGWLDYGMFMQSLMIAARGAGLHTCPQMAFCKFHRILRRHLDIPDEELVICGMSIGYADLQAPENRFVTRREPVEGFTRFLDL